MQIIEAYPDQRMEPIPEHEDLLDADTPVMDISDSEDYDTRVNEQVVLQPQTPEEMAR